MGRLSKGRRKRSRWRWNRSVSHYVLCLCQITQETSQTHMQLLEAWFRSTPLHNPARWNKRIMAVLLDTGTCVQSMWVSLRGSHVSAPVCACHTICCGSCFCPVKGTQLCWALERLNVTSGVNLSSRDFYCPVWPPSCNAHKKMNVYGVCNCQCMCNNRRMALSKLWPDHWRYTIKL